MREWLKLEKHYKKMGPGILFMGSKNKTADKVRGELAALRSERKVKVNGKKQNKRGKMIGEL